MKIEKYIIGTNDGEFIRIEQSDDDSLYVMTSTNPLSENCWFENTEDINEFLKAMTYSSSLYKGFGVYGLTIKAVSPIEIKKLSINYNIEKDKIE